ncbi:[FeFe] hydrogenase H-cluster radical SAM maturase HydE [bacterium]|nr:[FeFe] hydrogenase H-cluster radical SAM maturase HydE [bacterium]
MNNSKENHTLTRTEIMTWLRERDEKRLNVLWANADSVRKLNVGDEVHLRGIIAFSNHCNRTCQYCGINALNKDLIRYAMTQDEIISAIREFESFEYHTVVLQSGEYPGIKRDWITELIKRIKSETNLAITLSLGERSESDLAEWKAVGADRYLLKFETSNEKLYESLHSENKGSWRKRIEMLQTLDKLGYEVGSGIMVGFPGQQFDDLINDLEMFKELNLDMIGIGPYIPHPATKLGKDFKPATVDAKQVPNNKLTTYKMIALTRLTCPLVNIPSTTSLAIIAVDGRAGGLTRGGNVVMPDLTPETFRRHYDIYPSYHREHFNTDNYHHELMASIRSMGRRISSDSGVSLKFKTRNIKISNNDN